MAAMLDLPHCHAVIKQFIKTEGSVFVLQISVSENVGKMRGCLMKGIIFSNFTMIPSRLNSSAIAEYMNQGFDKSLSINFYCVH